MKYLKKFESDDNSDDLIKACEWNDIMLVKKLIKNGADLNVKNSAGHTPLCLSIFYDNRGYTFFDHLQYKDREKFKKLFPEKYKEYLIKKDAEKYNL